MPLQSSLTPSSSALSLAKLGPPIAALLMINGFQHFAEEIPNGYRVPNPYPQGGVWGGVGHFKVGGGGDRNPFGNDFQAQGFQWTQDLCQADSDGDGRSNGVELGDPDCQWSSGGPDPDLPARSHPGIADEPLEDESSIQSSCSDYEEPATAIQYDMKFDQPASIDESRTHYVCQQMEVPVPSAQVLHSIKSTALVDNESILHHMFVFFCFDGGGIDGNRVGDGPYSCDGAESLCTRVAGWAIGPKEECLPTSIGKEFNFSGMENVVVKIEAHYDNTMGTPQQDQSGIRVTFTPELRPLIAGMSAWGMDVINKDFVIPPQQEAYRLKSICPTEATAMLEHPIYVFQFYPHMHLLGRSMYTEHYRCGKKIGEIGRIEGYEFDNQQQYSLIPTVKVLPGDALVTTCEFNSMDQNSSVTAGLGTVEEMCVSFMNFYPRLEKQDLLGGCFSFENGVDLTRVTLPNGGGGDLPEGSAVDLSIVNGRFALFSSNPLEGLLTNFTSDPLASWATCCDTDTCDSAFLAAQGEACGLDMDCNEGLVCAGGLCATITSTNNNGGDDSPDQNSEVDSGANKPIIIVTAVSIFLAATSVINIIV